MCNLAEAKTGPPQPTLRPWLGSSFTSLRAHGAFLLSGSLSESGKVGPVTVVSERGGNFTFLTPWPSVHATPKVVATQGGAVVVASYVPSAAVLHVEPGERLFRFATRVNGSYTITVKTDDDDSTGQSKPAHDRRLDVAAAELQVSFW